MLNLKICFVDNGPLSYSVNSLYNQVLPRTQMSLLYLLTALAVRPNQITLVSQRQKAEQQGNLTLLPLPEDPESFWSQQDFDLVVILNQPELVLELKPLIDPKIPLLLWLKLPPEHPSVQALKYEELGSFCKAYIFDSASQRADYMAAFPLELHKCHYRWPGIIRSLRKRFMTSDELKAKRPNDQLVLAYTMMPEYGLEHILKMYQEISASTPDLHFKLLLPPDYTVETDTPIHQTLVQACRDDANIEVVENIPWIAYVEHLLEVHIVCNLLDCKLPNGDSILDPLAAGCAVLSSKHPSLEEISKDSGRWVEMEPSEDYLERYKAQLIDLITAFQEDYDQEIKTGFRQMAAIQTHFTWDLRVWEWESLFFQLAVCSDFTELPAKPESAVQNPAH